MSRGNGARGRDPVHHGVDVQADAFASGGAGRIKPGPFRHRLDGMLKRALDVLGAGTLGLATLPLVALGATTVLIEDGRPVFFSQVRAGMENKPFLLRKLRTMRRNEVPPAEVGQVREEHPLVLRSGRWLRRLKLDELPQLLNVLLGEMSLVGPRPTLPEQAVEYSEFEARRLEVRPGLTGWAQVNGNVNLTWAERIALDVWYVDHRSLWLDLEILVRTLAVIARGERRDESALREAMLHADGFDRRG